MLFDLPASALFLGVPWLTIVAVAVVTDCRERKIPNWTSLSLVGLFPIALLTNTLSNDALTSILIAAGVFACTFGLWMIKVIGAGDAKLISACSLWIGLELIFPFMIVVAFAGGIAALCCLLVYWWRLAANSNGRSSSQDAVALAAFDNQSGAAALSHVQAGIEAGTSPGPNAACPEKTTLPKVPYAIAIGAGAIWVWPQIFMS